MLFFSLLSYSLSAVEPPVDLTRACITPDGDIVVKWQGVKDTCGSFTKAYLHARKDPSSNYQVIDSLFSLAPNEYLHVDARTVSYQWEYYLEIHSDCQGDTLFSDTVQVDISAPNATIDSISVVNGKVVLASEQITAPDAWGFIIYKYDGFNNNIYDTVYSGELLLYEDLLSDPQSKALSYTIAAFDSCFNLGLISDPHRTIHLSRTLDTCAGTITLSWNNYQGWSNLVTTHNVYVRVDNGTAQQLATYSGSVAQFIYSGAEPGKQYEFFIQAVSDDGATSTSNLLPVSGNFSLGGDSIQLQTVSVVDGQDIRVEWQIPAGADVQEVALLKGYAADQMDTLVKLGTNQTFYLDTAVSVDDTVYYYKVVGLNPCGLWGIPSVMMRNIVLELDGTFEERMLMWNEYIGWDTTVSYDLYRSNMLGEPPSYSVITTTPELEATDTEVFDEVGNEGLCYQVVASAIDEPSLRALSNRTCAIGTPIVHFPNAFSPGGMNPYFRPEGLFIDYARSDLTIYNRWGETIYYSPFIYAGWDGTGIDDEWVPEGTYVYVVTIYGFDDSRKSYSGTVYVKR